MEEDTPFFFGREAFTDKLRAAVETQPLVAVVGRSGSSKSSVVRAGLVPSLRHPDGDGVWEVVTLVPGRQPLQTLAGALLPLLELDMTETDRLVEVNKQARYLASGDLRLFQVIERVLAKQNGTDRLLLVVDQWEELYTFQAGDEQAEAQHRRDVTCFIDELLAACRLRGLPIGNLTSQFWSNCYLHPFDQFVTRELCCRAYLRYVDDMALFSDSKPRLWAWKQAIVERLAQLRLSLHEGSAQAAPVSAGIPWLGFVIYPTHRRLKARKAVQATRRLTERFDAWRESRISFAEFDASVQGWINHVRYADSWGLRENVLRHLVWGSDAYANLRTDRTRR